MRHGRRANPPAPKIGRVDRRRFLVAAAVGTLAGLFSGLFGVGGGVVIVSMLILWLHVEEHKATAVSLAAITVIATVATITHSGYGTLHVVEGVVVGVPALAGVLIGTAVQRRLPGTTVALLFSALLIAVALSMLIGAGDPEPSGTGTVSRDLEHILIAGLFGLGAGVVSGLAGVGGGNLFVPGLVYVLGLSQIEAEATSLLAIVPVSLLGTWRHYRYGNLDLRMGLTIGALAIPGALLGVVIANALPGRVLQIGFAGLLLFVSQSLIRTTLRKRRDAQTPPTDDDAAPGS